MASEDLLEESDSGDGDQFSENVWLSLNPLLNLKTKQFNRDKKKEKKLDLQNENHLSEEYVNRKKLETISAEEKLEKEKHEKKFFSVTVPGIGPRSPDFSINYLELNNSLQFRNQRPRSAPQGSRSLGPDSAFLNSNPTIPKGNLDQKLPIPKCLKSSNQPRFLNNGFSSLFSVTSSGRNAVQGPLERELLNVFDESEISEVRFVLTFELY